MSKVFDFEWAGEKLQLQADNALLLQRTKTLIIADPHFGKPSSFRNSGIPVPIGTTQADLDRLSILLEETAATRFIVLGDFFHHRTGQCERTMELISNWRSIHSTLAITIVMGNHDRSSDDPPAEWNINYLRHPLTETPFLFCHEPCSSPGLFVLSGHIHPSITLRDVRGYGLRLPCFLFSEDCALLPAFGGFTGTANVKPKPGDQVFAIADQQIFRIPVKAPSQAL